MKEEFLAVQSISVFLPFTRIQQLCFAVWLMKWLRQQEDCKVYFKTMYHFKSAGGKGSFKIAETQQSHKSGDYFECVRIYEGYNLGMDFYDT